MHAALAMIRLLILACMAPVRWLMVTCLACCRGVSAAWCRSPRRKLIYGRHARQIPGTETPPHPPVFIIDIHEKKSSIRVLLISANITASFLPFLHLRNSKNGSTNRFVADYRVDANRPRTIPDKPRQLHLRMLPYLWRLRSSVYSVQMDVWPQQGNVTRDCILQDSGAGTCRLSLCDQ